jgi:hypothetical protein
LERGRGPEEAVALYETPCKLGQNVAEFLSALDAA